MKIAFVTSTFPTPQEPTKGVFNLRAVNQLLENNTEVTVFKLKYYRPFKPILKTTTYHTIQVQEVSCFAVPGLVPYNQYINIFLAKITLWYVLKKIPFKYDIIHSVGIHYSGIVSGYLSEKTGIPHVAQGIGSDINIHLKRFTTNYVTTQLKHTNCFIFNSQSLLNTFNKNTQGITAPKKVCYRGVDYTHFSKAQKQINSSPTLNLLYLGGIPSDNPDLKGGMFVLNLWNKLRKTEGIHIRFGGPETKEYFNKSNPENYASNSNFEMIGLIKHEEVRTNLEWADILLMPSENEGLPNLALEAMATQTTLMASDKDFFSEIIDHTTDGILLNKDVTLWTDKLNELLHNKAILKQMGEKAAQKVKTKYNKEQYPAELIKTYHDCTRNNIG